MAPNADAMNRFSRKIPVWYQLAMLLRSDILSGALPGGMQINSELELAARYGVSVMPVRQALKSLEAEGLVTRQRGRGTFVTPGRQVGGYTSLESLYTKEFDTPPELLERGRMETPPAYREAGMDEPEIAFVRRVAFRNGAAWSYGVLYFLCEFEDKLTSELLLKYPTYRLLEERCGLLLRWTNFTIRASAASPEVAEHLRIDPFTAVLNMTAITYDGDERLIGGFDMSFSSDQQAFEFRVPHHSDF